MVLRFVASIALLLLLCCNPSSAGEDNYVVVFGSQRVPNNEPDYSHTFATFVKVAWPGDGPCPPAPIVEHHTISWTPQNGIVRVNALLPECGRNYSLPETLAWAQANCMRTSMWGPYRCCPSLYCGAKKQLRLLNSGQVRYKANDVFCDSEKVSNCIHAAAGVVGGMRLVIASPGWGETASFALLQRYQTEILDRQPTPWVASAIGLDQYALIRRDWKRPYSGIAGPFYRALGGERNLQATFGP